MLLVCIADIKMILVALIDPKLLKFMTVKSYVLSISFDIGYNQNIKEYYFL